MKSISNGNFASDGQKRLRLVSAHKILRLKQIHPCAMVFALIFSIPFVASVCCSYGKVSLATRIYRTRACCAWMKKARVHGRLVAWLWLTDFYLQRQPTESIAILLCPPFVLCCVWVHSLMENQNISSFACDTLLEVIFATILPMPRQQR